MPKLALCIPADQKYLPMDQWTTTLVDRAICETDLSTLQIIPYVALRNERGEFFAYTRGSKGQESRLHALKSIGAGGHVDFEVTTTLADLLASEAQREVSEELGYTGTLAQFAEALRSATILYHTTTPVDAVHIGVAIIIDVLSADVKAFEAGVILNPEWIALDELVASNNRQIDESGDDLPFRFETWSSLLVPQLAFEEMHRPALVAHHPV